MQLKVRRGEAVRSAMAPVVVGISEDGYREILGFKIALRETGESWRELLGELKKRGLSGVELATSDAHEAFEEGLLDATAVLALPEKYRERLRTTNMMERLIQEIRRREKVIRIFPNKASAWRLVGALLAEKHEEWSTGRRYWTIEEFYEWRTREPGRDAQELKSESPSPTLQPA